MARFGTTGTIVAGAMAVLSLLSAPAMSAGRGSVAEARGDEVTVVTLTQTPCLFLESEDRPRAYTSTGKEDCERINQRTLAGRSLKTLRVRPGRYIFRVTNQDVPYEVGFWIRGQGLGRVTLPSVSGGGLTLGRTREYELTLVKGTYSYSCPLNPTPDYTLVVE